MAFQSFWSHSLQIPWQHTLITTCCICCTADLCTEGRIKQWHYCNVCFSWRSFIAINSNVSDWQFTKICQAYFHLKYSQARWQWNLYHGSSLTIFDDSPSVEGIAVCFSDSSSAIGKLNLIQTTMYSRTCIHVYMSMHNGWRRLNGNVMLLQVHKRCIK